MVDYLDAFELALNAHIAHRLHLANEIRSNLQLDRNRRPGDFDRNIDFAENGSIKNQRALQSQYYFTKHNSLFMSVWSWLSAAEWDLSTGELRKGQ
ncbi:MAG: hypothetical protein ACRDQ5_26830 [Sciscionella sp.]